MARLKRQPDDQQPIAKRSAQPDTPEIAPPRAADYALQEEHTPDLGAPTRGQDPFPRVRPSSPFWLAYHRDRWDVVGGLLIPLLSQLSAVPGANGTDRGAGGKPDPSLALAMAEHNGLQIVPWDVDGPGHSYLRRVQVGLAQDRRTGADVPIFSWHSAFERLYPGSEAVESDTVAYARWVRTLVSRGVLAPPRPYVLERLESVYRERLARYAGKDPARAERLEQALDEIRAAKEALYSASTPVAGAESSASDALAPPPAAE